MNYNKTTLKNGLRVITVPMKDNPTVTVLVMVEAGSKYEEKNLSGISHFLEHMCFKGTSKRPKSMDVVKEMDSIGAEYNAFTGQEFTGYYAKSDKKHFDKIFDVVSDIYLNSTLPEIEMEKEKGFIIEEINMYRDVPQRHVHDLFMSLMYGDTPAGRNIAGTKETVSSFKRDDLVKYRLSHYVPSATTVIVSGGINEKEVISKIEKVFGKILDSRKTQKSSVVESQNNPEIFVENRETDQIHAVLGFRTFDAYDKRNKVLKVLSVILGGGMSSRLFQKIREEMGVAYYVGASSDSFTDHGFFSISVGLQRNRLEEVIVALVDEFKKLKKEIVSSEELEKAKEYIIGSLFLHLESSDEIAEFLGFQEIMKKKILTRDDLAKEIKKVTAKDVNRLAKEIFSKKGLNLAIVGPVRENQKTKLVDIMSHV